MFERDRSLIQAAKTITEQIEVAPEGRFERLKAWLKTQLVAAHFCPRHTGTRLKYHHGKSDIWPAVSQDAPPKEKPGVFNVRLALVCPACCCAYALCPPEFHVKTLETFDTSTAESAAALTLSRKFLQQVNQRGCGFALFTGAPGTGKTHLACNIVAALDDPDALYVRQDELTLALRATYGRKEIVLSRRSQYHGDDEESEPDTPPTALTITQGVRFLILDEIGCRPLANDDRLQLDELLKHRYDHRKPTILISNLAFEQLKEFLGDALIDRIRQATGGRRFIQQFSGKSFRDRSGDSYLGGLK